MKNVLIAQSGGPTAVINASLLGVIRGCQSHPRIFDSIYAARHGIEGVLGEELIDLSVQDDAELELLRTTPGAGAIGTCRYKVRPEQAEDMERIVEVLSKHSIGAFFYIGGNDSMDTAHRVANLSHQRGLDLVCVGIPKTIDNDLGDAERRILDHTPGYGSVARFWAELVLTLDEENRGSSPSDPVMIVQAMGRRIGYIPASARLADPRRELPLVLVLPESKLTGDQLATRIEKRLSTAGRAIVVVSEGYELPIDGKESGPLDSFGHVQFGARRGCSALALSAYLNDRGLSVRGSARWEVPGTMQRHAILHASEVDVDEAFAVGFHAARLAAAGEGGYMATIQRIGSAPYAVTYGAARLQEMAGSERVFPPEWITNEGDDVTDSFIAYASPLIGGNPVRVPREQGMPRYARLGMHTVTKRCDSYVPEAYRKGSEADDHLS